MAKLSAIIFLLVLISFNCDEVLVPMAEAKDCNKVWNCKGDKRCWDDCKNSYNGKGLCDLYTAPGVPKQCFCAYKC
ncbi:putative defensin-like protein 184 [Pistacia vera]|uniref:putative defensin-like protein 184 n=1 Tax=Pistacia vera TaxID=55513 RepID=UPI0012631425|nr:putative defensin-like protein 184 [Pistacia vera]